MSSTATLLAKVESIISKGDKNTVPQEVALYSQYKQLLSEAATYTAALPDLTNRLSIAQQKLSDSTEQLNKSNLSDQDKTKYANLVTETTAEVSKLQESIRGIQEKLNQAKSIPNKTIEDLQKKFYEDQFKKINPQGNDGLSYSKPENLVEYVIKTQAINPYSRERECDIRFIQDIGLVAGDMSLEAKQLEALKNEIKQRILDYKG